MNHMSEVSIIDIEPDLTALLGNADEAGELSRSGVDGMSAALATPRPGVRDV